jgi:F0F1-type ATP synthase delta subunit
MAKLSRKELAETIARLIHEDDTTDLPREIAAYLIAEKRVKELDSLMRDVALIRQQQYGITEATATTALPITDEVRLDIKKYLKAQNLVLNEQQQPSVIGGLRLEAGDTQLDITVHNRLRKLKLVSET